MSDGQTVGSISIKVTPDLNHFRRELHSELGAIEKTEQVDLDADVDTTKAKAEVRTAIAEMSRHKVHISVELDRSQLDEVKKLIESVGSGGGGVPTPPVGGIGAIAGPAGLALAAAAIAAAAPAAALLSGALASLPGILAGIAAPMGAVALGLDGIKAAAATIAPEFEALKAAVSDTFLQSLTPIFEQLKSIFPTLTAGMQQIASGLSTAFGGIVNALTSGDGLASLSTIFQNIGAAIGAAAPGLQSFTTGLLGMMADTSKLFPNIANVFNQLGASFGNWVTKITTANADGVTPLQTALTNLGSIASTIGPIIGDVFTKGFALLQNPTFVQNMQTIMSVVRGFVDALMFVSSAAAGTASALTLVFQAVQSVGNVFQNIASIISGAFSAAVSVASAGVSAIAGAVSAGFNGLVGIVSGAWDAVVGAVSAGVGAAIAAVSGMGSQIAGIASSWGGILINAGKAIMDGFLNGLKAGWNAVTGFIGGIAGWVAAHKGPISYDATLLVPHGEAMMAGLGDGLDSGFEDIKTKIAGMADQLANAFSKDLNLNIPDVKATGGSASASSGSGNKIDPAKYVKDGLNMPIDFMDTVAKSALGDLGISGGGALGALADLGMGFAKNAIGGAVTNIFNTSNVDDTLAIHQRNQNMQSVGLVGR